MDLIRLEQELKKNGEIVVDKLQEYAEKAGEKNFFYYGEEDRYVTFSEFNKLTNRIAHSLQSMGVKKGDRISLFLMNPLITSLAMFGIWKVGAIFCPINFNYKGRLLSYQINDTKPRLLITESGREPEINSIKEEIVGIPVFVHEPKKGDHDYVAANAGLTLDRKFRCFRFEELLQGETADLKTDIEYKDTASIIYTSGTTGPAKGVVQSFRWLQNYCFYFIKFQHPDDVIYNDLPLYHVGGAFANVARAAWSGCMVAVWDRFSPNDFWQRIEKIGATSATLLDIMMPWLLIPEETPKDKYNTLKHVHMQPLPEYHHQFAKRFGIDLVTSGYGQTESGAGFVGIIDEFGDEEGTPKELYKGLSKEEFKRRAQDLGLSIISGDAKIKKGYMGNVSVLLEAAILNENDRILGPNEHGQLAFRSRLPFFLFNEYFNKPEATAETYRNQWLHTGDAAYRDTDGIYYFVDRMGGFIRTRGENISSYQIEDIINSHPKVSVCAAFPVPAAEGLEDDCVVYIAVIPGEKLEEKEIREWIKSEMPKFMWPKYIRFVDVMPQTPTYKIEKYKLKKLFLSEP